MTPKEAIEFLIYSEVFEAAIEALEKQVERKPNKTRYNDGTLCCPDCLWDGFGDETYDKKLLSYCPSCGQAIDWSEEE